MIGTLVWKDYREQRGVWLAMAVLAVLTMVVAQLLFKSEVLLTPADQEVATLWLALILAGSYGVVCGSILLANERETQTLPFLDALTGLRLPVWRTKLVTGAALTTAYAVPVAVTALALGVGASVDLPDGLRALIFFLILALVGLVALAWGMLMSAVFANVLAAAAAALVALVVALGLTMVLTVSLRAPAGFVVAHGALTLVAFWGSRRVFCRSDSQRWHSATAEETGRSTGPRRGWAVLFWLCWRQGRVVIPALVVFSLTVTATLLYSGMLAWPLVTGLVGVACGIATFAPEQGANAQRFLGDQRLPPGRVWTAKTLFWLAIAGVVAGLLLGLEFLIDRDGGDFNLATLIDLGTFVPLWLIYGFSVALLLAVMVRKTVVAVFLAIPLTIGLTGLWLPSLLAGGLAAWQWLMIPTLLLTASRVALWPWWSGTLGTRRPVLALSGLGSLGVAWLAGTLWYRVAEVPDVGEPFDVAAYEADLPTTERNQGGRLMGSIAHALAVEMGRDSAGNTSRFRQLTETPLDEWPKKQAELAQWLHKLAEGTWAEHIRELMPLPLGMIEDPRMWDRNRLAPILVWLRQAGTLLQYHALELQFRGNEEGALDGLVALLALSRQLRNHATAEAYLAGTAIENGALRALAVWQRRLRQRKLLARAQDELTRHEAQIPPLSNQVKAQYLAFRSDLYGLGRPDSQRTFMTAVSLAPWERSRRTRIGNAIFSGWLRSAEMDYWKLCLNPYVVYQLDDLPLGAYVLATWSPPAEGPGSSLTLQRLGKLVDESRLFWALPTWSHLSKASARSIHEVRSLRIELAAALYRAEHPDKPAPTIEDLVPRYLPAALIDPITGNALPLEDAKQPAPTRPKGPQAPPH